MVNNEKYNSVLLKYKKCDRNFNALFKEKIMVYIALLMMIEVYKNLSQAFYV